MASRPKPRSADFKNSYALVIGINAYRKGIKPLRTAVNDATKLASLLESEHKYKVTLLTSDKGVVSKQRIQSILTDEFQHVGKRDRFLFYFAGHGIALEGDDGPEGYIVPQDADGTDRETLLPMTALHQWLTTLSCRHMLAILDCCFAGAIKWSFSRSGGFEGVEVIHKERYARYIRSKAWQVLTSAAHNQEALDVVSGQAIGARETGEEAHSPFANALINGLKGAADLIPRDGGDGIITASELALYLREEVETEAKEVAAHNQTPMLWKLKQHEHGEFVFVANPDALNLPDAPKLDANSSPWKGLQAYTQEDEKRFFGRTAVIQALETRVINDPFTIVTGGFGTGKSSVVMAGLLPILKQNPVWKNARVKTIRPDTKPRETIVNTLRTIRTVLQRGEARHAIVVIDQFEEVVTHGSRADIAAVLNQIGDANKMWPNRLRVIVIIRTDFESHFRQESSALKEIWTKCRYVVERMKRDELREVIIHPAEQSVLYFKPETLVNTLVDEVYGMPGGLPLLSFTLNRLYDEFIKQYQKDRERADRALTGEAYRAIGELSGALQKVIEELYQHLDDREQETIKHILLRLVAIDDTQMARRRIRQDELEYSDAGENERVKKILNHLENKHLIIMDGQSIELAHDVLTTTWDKLVVWRTEAIGTYLSTQRRVTTASYDWETESDQRKKKGLLWHDSPRLPELQRGQNGASNFPHWLNRLERKFAEESEFERRVREAYRKRQSRRILAQSLALLSPQEMERLKDDELGILLALEAHHLNINCSGGLAWAIDPALRTAVNKHLFSSQLSGHNDKISSVAFSPNGRWLASGGRDHTIRLWPFSPITMDGEPIVLEGHTQGVQAVAFSPDGNWLASGSMDKTVRLWPMSNLNTQPIVLTGHKRLIRSVAFSPDGKWFASGSDDRTICLWSMAQLNAEPMGAQPIVLTGHDLAVNSVTFSPDGTWLASGSDDNTIRLWSLSRLDAQPTVLTGHDFAVQSVAFSPDSAWLASGSGKRFSAYNTIRLWSMAQLSAESIIFEGHNSIVKSVQFSPDGKWLASASMDKTIRLWSLSYPTQEPTIVLADHESIIDSVTFSPDGTWLASGGRDRMVRLWSLSRPVVLNGHKSHVQSLAFSPNGKWLASGSDDRTIRLWSFSEPGSQPSEKPIVLADHGSAVSCIVFSPDKKRSQLVSGSGDLFGDDQTMRLWSVCEPSAKPTVLPSHNAWVSSAAFSPDGTWLASGYDDGTIWLSSMCNPSKKPIVLNGHKSRVQSIAFSPDGTWLASASDQYGIRLWSLCEPTPTLTVLKGHKRGVQSVAFSPDSKQLASASVDKTIRLWSMCDLDAKPTILAGHESKVNCVAFSPDEKWLASASDDRMIRLWSLSQLNTESIVLEGHAQAVLFVTFSPDGKRLASASEDRTIRLWTPFAQLAEEGYQKVRRNMRWEEWQRYLPGETYQRTNPYLPVHSSVLDADAEVDESRWKKW